MPSVAAFKRENDRPIEDVEREAAVQNRAVGAAISHGIDPEGAAMLFRVQIELAKAVQRRTPEEASSLPLGQVRPVLSVLGDRILESLGRAVPIDPEELESASWAPLAEWIEPEERQRLSRALIALRRSPTP